MAKWGSCDFEQLKHLRERLQALERVDADKFCRAASKELAARLLALVIPRTPVGVYDKDVSFTTKDGRQVTFKANSGKKGGTLRRGWTAKTHEAAASGEEQDGAVYAKSLQIYKNGDNYTIVVTNPVKYASYVEFGHRTSGNGWVNGRYFLTLSEDQLRQLAPGILQRKLDRLLRGVFKDG